MNKRQRKKLIKKHGSEWFERYQIEMQTIKRLGMKPRHRNEVVSGISLLHREIPHPIETR